jgi:hypothetical protein
MNAMNQANDKKNEWADMNKPLIDRAVAEVKKINPEDIKRTATELTTKVRDVSAATYDDAVGYVRRNPVTAAAGLVAFGFVAGVMSNMLRKSV